MLIRLEQWNRIASKPAKLVSEYTTTVAAETLFGDILENVLVTCFDCCCVVVVVVNAYVNNSLISSVY